MDALTTWRPDFLCRTSPTRTWWATVFEAVVKAVETTDRCLEKVMETAKSEGYVMVVIADHGNADLARNADGTPHTAHTTNPVPMGAQPGARFSPGRHFGRRGSDSVGVDGVPQPEEMTGQSLCNRRIVQASKSGAMARHGVGLGAAR